jgi:glycosyltransferase involved in cell wall biosynthesis
MDFLHSTKCKPIKVVITSGVRMFHLPYLAGALNPETIDYTLLIGLYPTPHVKRFLRVFSRRKQLKVLARQHTIPLKRIQTCVVAELFAQLHEASRRLFSFSLLDNLLAYFVHYTFAFKALLVLQRARPNIYHYRCAFGLFSLAFANKNGMIKLCDHSIAHPILIDYLTNNRGCLPESRDGGMAHLGDVGQRLMQADLGQADHIVVNSEFVKHTLLFAGVPPEKVSVVELSVDEKFIKSVNSLDESVRKRPANELLFAGSWVKRKGIDWLAQAVENLSGLVKLRIAGTSTSILRQYCHSMAVSEAYFSGLGYLSREDLAQEMLQTRIFIFPSFCEGYAKTIQEAMVCGCYIIATPNSGFSLGDGACGILVDPGEPEQLAEAIKSALADPMLDAYCRRNRDYAHARYSPASYADNMQKLYQKLLG